MEATVWFHHNKNLVERAIPLHGMYESTMVFISILKWKDLYIVGWVQCDICIFSVTRITAVPTNNDTASFFLTWIPKWENQMGKLIFINFAFQVLLHYTVVYSIVVNHRLNPDLKLAALYLWDLGGMKY